MAYELFPEAHGAILRAELEQTYSSATVTVAANDVYRCPPDATVNSYKRVFIDRSTQAAYVTGVRSSAGQAMGEYSIGVNLDHQVINNPTLATENSIAGVPKCDLFMRAGGWQASHTANTNYSGVKPDGVTLAGNGTDQILLYTYEPRSTGASFTSSRMQYTEIVEGATNGLLHDLQGARHGWSLTMPGGDHWALACDGKSLASKPSRVATPTANSTFDDNTAIVGLGANYAVTKMLATAATFGKTNETDDASTMTAFVYDMTLASNLTVQEVIAPNGAYGVAQVRYMAGRPRITCTLDQVVWDLDWDLYTFADEGRAIRVSHAVPAPGSSPTSFVVFKGTFEITDIVRGSANGYRNVELTMDYLYNDSGGDGGGLAPGAGLTLAWVTTV